MVGKVTNTERISPHGEIAKGEPWEDEMKSNGYRCELPVTPRTLRARIETRMEMIKGEDPESHLYVTSLQRIAELERDLDRMEKGR